jgi:hypothetical protein
MSVKYLLEQPHQGRAESPPGSGQICRLYNYSMAHYRPVRFFRLLNKQHNSALLRITVDSSILKFIRLQVTIAFEMMLPATN